MKVLRAMPVLQVGDMARSVAFYNRMGFHGDGWTDDGGDVVFTVIQRGDVTIALQHTKGPPPVNSHWAAYIYVEDLRALHGELKDAGLAVTEVRTGLPYGCDDFDLRDPDGHLIAFGQDLDPRFGAGLGEQRGKG